MQKSEPVAISSTGEGRNFMPIWRSPEGLFFSCLFFPPHFPHSLIGLGDALIPSWPIYSINLITQVTQILKLILLHTNYALFPTIAEKTVVAAYYYCYVKVTLFIYGLLSSRGKP